MKKLALLITLTLITMLGFSQKQTDNQFNSWWTYSGNHTLSEKFSVHTLYSWRRNNFVKDWQQSLLRIGLNYKVKDNFITTIGYDWVETFPYGKQPIAKQTTEQRIFEQVILKNKVGIVKFKHRYKLEQRFSNKAPVKNRFRYRLGFSIPLGKKESKLSFNVFDEIFINLGTNIKGYYFNQNWIYLGLGYKLNKKSTIKLGYMNQYLMKGDFIHVESNHTLQVGYSHNFNFSKLKQ